MKVQPRDLMVARAVSRECLAKWRVAAEGWQPVDLTALLKSLPEPAEHEQAAQDVYTREEALQMAHLAVEEQRKLSLAEGARAERRRAAGFIRNRAGIAAPEIAPVLTELAERIERADYRRAQDEP